LSRSRRSSGRGQTVIIVEDDGGESTSRKPIRTTNPPPPFLFHPPVLAPARHLPAHTRARDSPRLTLGDASSILQALFQMRGHQLHTGPNKRSPLAANPDPAPEAKRQVTGRLPSDSTSLLRLSSSKKSYRLGVRLAGKRLLPGTDHLFVGYSCCFV